MIRCALARDPQAARRRCRGARSPSSSLGQHARVDHDAVADHAALAGVEDPGRDQVELPRLAVADDRVAGVVAALEAHDGVGVLGEQVDDLALALVAPLGADDHDAWHADECRRRRPASYGRQRATRRLGRATLRAVVAEERQRRSHISSSRETVRSPICSRELVAARGSS